MLGVIRPRRRLSSLYFILTIQPVMIELFELVVLAGSVRKMLTLLMKTAEESATMIPNNIVFCV